MKANVGIWGKLTWVVVILGLLCGLALLVGWYLPLINQNERMRSDIFEKNIVIQREQATNRALKASIDAINHDPKTVERLARERLGYAKPGETVIRFEEPVTNNPPSR